MTNKVNIQCDDNVVCLRIDNGLPRLSDMFCTKYCYAVCSAAVRETWLLLSTALRLSALHSFTYPGHDDGSGHLATTGTAATAGARGQLAQFLDTDSVPALPTATAQGRTTRRITYIRWLGAEIASPNWWKVCRLEI